jgi:hypothetical protein
MIYISFIIILFFFSFIEAVGLGNGWLYKRDDKYFFIIFSVFMVGIAALRYKTGGDWYNYIERFNKIKLPYNPVSDFEFGYYLLNVIFKYGFNNYFLMQFFIELFCGICVCRHIYKYSDYPVLSLFFYFLFLFFDLDTALNRQYLAIAVVLCGYTYIKKRRFIPYLLIVLLAMQFHITAFACILIYFFNKHTSTYRAFFIILFSLFINFFGLDIIRNIIIFLMPFLPEKLYWTANSYFHSTVHSAQWEYGSGLGFLIKLIIMCLITLLNRNTKIDNVFFNSFLFFFLLSGINRNVPIFGRFGLYFMVIGGSIFSYNILLKNNLLKKLFSIKYIYILVLLLYFIVTFYKSFWVLQITGLPPKRSLWIPYHSIIMPIDQPGREALGFRYTNGVLHE